MMRKVVLCMLLMIGFSVLAFGALEDDPALRIYTVGAETCILYENLTGVPADNVVVMFDNPVVIDVLKTMVFGGPVIYQIKDILGDGTYWGIYTNGGDSLLAADFIVLEGTIQIYFTPVDVPAVLVDIFMG